MTKRRSRTTRFLPEYVTRFKSQHGVERLRFRRKGFKGGYFTAALGTEAFREEYHAFIHPEQPHTARPPQRAKPGSLDEALNRYMATPERLGPTAVI